MKNERRRNVANLVAIKRRSGLWKRNFFYIGWDIKKMQTYVFSVDEDSFVLRIEYIEGICADIKSRFVTDDFHV